MKLSFFTRSFLAFLVLSGACFSRHVQAVEIPGDNIDYEGSQIHIEYTAASGANTSLECFGVLNNSFSKSLSNVGITSLDGISSVVSGDTNACFQKAGEYRVMLLLVDTAGNSIAYPSGLPVPLSPAQRADPNNYYTITVTPSVPVIDPSAPQGGTEVTEFENDPDGPGGNPPVTGGNCDISSDGVSNCMVEVIFRDAFGNLVTQLDSVDDVSVYLGISSATKEADIDIDGLFEPLVSGTELDANNAFDATNSKDTFLQEVFAGGTGANGDTLEALLNDGSQPEIANVTMVSPGHFRFMIRSYVPTIKLLNESDPSAGAGVYAQPLSFDLAFPPIDANGILGGTKQRWGGLVNGDFIFRPVADALPTISPARFIGAYIEGSVQGSRDDVLIYEIENGADNIGTDTAYVGDVNNEAIRDDLLQQVDRAII